MEEALAVLVLGNLCRKDQEQWPQRSQWGSLSFFLTDKVIVTTWSLCLEREYSETSHLRVNVSGLAWRESDSNLNMQTIAKPLNFMILSGQFCSCKEIF